MTKKNSKLKRSSMPAVAGESEHQRSSWDTRYMNYLVRFPQLFLCFLYVHLCLFVSALFGLTSFFRVSACSGCQWLLERLNSISSLLAFITCSIFRIS